MKGVAGFDAMPRLARLNRTGGQLGYWCCVPQMSLPHRAQQLVPLLILRKRRDSTIIVGTPHSQELIRKPITLLSSLGRGTGLGIRDEDE